MRGRTPVFAKPATGKLRLVIVGEGPGKREVAKGEPFIGLSGALLNEVLSEAEIARSDCHITNGTLCKPENDWEAEQGAACCAPRLLRELREVDVPILTLGKDPTRTILGVTSIIYSRGFVWTLPGLEREVKAAEAGLRSASKRLDKGLEGDPSDVRKLQAAVSRASNRLALLQARSALAGRRCFPSVHPAFVLRSDAWRPILALDIRRVGRWLRGELDASRLADSVRRADSIADFQRNTGVYISLDKPDDVASACSALGGTVASDIETDGLNPITANIDCICLSDGKRTVVIAPWVPAIHAPLYSRIVSKRTVVFHNGYNFDQIALERDGVVFGKVEDTLIAHHAFAAHLPQKLDQVASEFVDSGPWKMEHGMRGGNQEKGSPMARMTSEERDLYNAIDGVVTARAWFAMQEDLKPEWRTYEHDKQLALLCKRMQVVGIGVDEARRTTLAIELAKRANELHDKMRSILGGDTAFSAAKPKLVRQALFTTLRAPILGRTKTGLPDTSEATLEAFAKQETPLGEFSRALMTWRLCSKILATYVNGIPVLADHRAHYNWKSFGTVSGRLACRFQSNPRYGSLPEQKPRELYVPSKEILECRLVAQVHDAAIFEVGGEFVYFDLSQAEARMAAYLSGDPALIEAVQEDIHTANAIVAFGGIPEAVERLRRANEKSPILDAFGKPMKWKSVERKFGGCKEERDITKNGGFCIWYVGSAEKMFETYTSKGFPISLRACQAMHTRFHDRYYRYYRYADRLLADVRQCGYLRTPILGRLCRMGFFPKPTEVVNRPIQSGIADVMNERLLEIDEACRRMTRADDVESVVRETWARPVVLPKSQVVDAEREFVIPIDFKRGRSWGEL